MPAPKGNKFWLARSSHGAKPKFSDPEVLLKACLEYFEWCEDNPLQEHKVIVCEGCPTDVYIDKLRATTLDGLTLFLDIAIETWHNYRKVKDLMAVTSQVDRAIRNQKFSGASSGLLNANIIARDLGLVDKKEVKQDIVLGEKLVDEMSDEELQNELDREE